MRYISVVKLAQGKIFLHVDWINITNLLNNSRIPIHPDVFEGACKAALDKHIGSTWGVPLDNPDASRPLPYMASLIIYECARQILIKDLKPDEEGDIGDETVPKDQRAEERGLIQENSKGTIEVVNKLGI